MRFVLSLVILAFSIASSACALEPVASISIAGWDRVQSDVQELSTLSEHPELLDKLTQRLKAIPKLDGLNAQGPVGVWAYVEDEQPCVAVAVPVEDFDLVRQSLMSRLKIKLTAGDSPGNWTFSFPNRTVHFRVQGNFVVVSDKISALNSLTDDVLKQLTDDIIEDDIVVRLDLQHLPREWVQKSLEQVQKEFEKNTEKKKNESDREFKIREHIRELASTIATRIVQDTESLTARLKIENGIQLAVDWKILDDSPLSYAVAELPLEEKGPIPGNNAAASISLAVSLPPEMKQILLDAEAIVRDHLRAKVGGHLLREDRMPADEVFDTFEASIEKGNILGNVQFVPNSEGYMILLAAMNMERINGMTTSLRTVLPYTRDDEKIQSVEFDVITTKGAAIHRIVGTDANNEDRKIYGGVPALYIGTSTSAAWFAAGKTDTEIVLKESLSRAAKTHSHLASVHLQLMPWVELANKNGAQDDGFHLLKETMTSETDELRATISLNDAIISANIHAESGYERLLGEIVWKLLD